MKLSEFCMLLAFACFNVASVLGTIFFLQDVHYVGPLVAAVVGVVGASFGAVVSRMLGD